METLIRTRENQPSVAASDNLSRSIGMNLRAADANGEAGDGYTIHGLATPFGVRSLIDSWEGTFEEQFKLGAFKRTLNNGRVIMQFNHGRDSVFGALPLGTYNDGFPREVAEGLEIEGTLHRNWLVEPVREAIASGSITGMSIRFSVVRQIWTDVSGKEIKDANRIAELIWMPPEEGPLLRTITEVKLFEAGPVVWPQYDTTTVGVRSIDVTDLGNRDTRSALARALILADRLDVGHTDPSTADPRTIGQVAPPRPTGKHSTDERRKLARASWLAEHRAAHTRIVG